jgi:hypothetical protein
MSETSQPTAVGDRTGLLGGAPFIGFIGLSVPSFDAPFMPCVELGYRLAFPSGWNDARVQRLLDHYETQSDMEAVAEDEAAYQPGSELDARVISYQMR